MEYIARSGDKEGKVFLDKHKIDKYTMGQIKRMIEHPSVSHARIMPDCHRGKGCCIGFTSILEGKVVPNFVGGDIGCGIITYPIGKLPEEHTLEILDDIIRTRIPMGKDVHKEIALNDTILEQLCIDAKRDAIDFAHSYFDRYKIKIHKKVPDYDIEWFSKYCIKISIEEDYARKGFGTLGGGNHFIEINKDSNDDKYITIHSGSRSFGDHVCRYHQNKITSTKYYDWSEHDKTMNKIKRNIKDKKRLKMVHDEIREKFYAARHADYLCDDEAYEYFFDMIFAQKYAQYNRRYMLQQILQYIDINFIEENVIESVHNYIDFGDFVLRKGAIAAYRSRLCIISLNMRDGILVCRGKNNKDWNYSAAHGSGRLLNRNQAFNSITYEEFKESMEGIYSNSVKPETIDESPMVYKDSDMIKDALGDTVDIIDQLFPVLNVKALT